MMPRLARSAEKDRIAVTTSHARNNRLAVVDSRNLFGVNT
jgi:hypothetical protein